MSMMGSVFIAPSWFAHNRGKNGSGLMMAKYVGANSFANGPVHSMHLYRWWRRFRE
jgi:hypothetical protein